MRYKDLVFDKNAIFLVTGGAGFIGSNLCEAILEMGYTVRCLDNFTTGKKENILSFINNDRFTLIEGDIRDFDTCLEATNGVTYVLHQAAWGSVPRSIELPLLYEEVNIKGTLNMLEASKQNKVKKFIYASSSSVYGDDPNLPKIEERVGKVLSPYALTKKVNEEYGRLYYELYKLETIGLRYFNVFGRRQDPNGAYAAVIPKFVNLLLKGEKPTIYGNGNQSRDFTYIDNVIEANLKVCSSTSTLGGEVFNIAFGGNITISDCLEIINNILNKNILPVYMEKRLGDIMHSNADISKARTMFNYFPEYDFYNGLVLYIKWIMENSNI